MKAPVSGWLILLACCSFAEGQRSSSCKNRSPGLLSKPCLTNSCLRRGLGIAGPGCKYGNGCDRHQSTLQSDHRISA